MCSKCVIYNKIGNITNMYLINNTYIVQINVENNNTKLFFMELMVVVLKQIYVQTTQ